METVGVRLASTNSDTYASNSNPASSIPSSPTTRGTGGGGSSSRRTTTTSSSSSFPVVRFLQAPVTTIFEYSGVLRPRSSEDYHESESLIPHNHNHSSSDSVTASSNSDGNNNEGEVAIRIMGDGEQVEEHGEDGEESTVIGGDVGGGEREMADSSDVDSGGGNGSNRNGDSSSQQRYDLQQVSRWIEQILPFSLLLIVVFIRQHLQGTRACLFGIQFND